MSSKVLVSNWVNLISEKQYKTKLSSLEALKIQRFQIWMNGMNSENTFKNQILMLLFFKDLSIYFSGRWGGAEGEGEKNPSRLPTGMEPARSHTGLDPRIPKP